MDEQERKDVARSIGDLLAIAKLAMPSYLFAQDPRVLAAQQLLARLSPEPLEQLLPRPAWDITEGIDRFMASTEAPESRSDAVVQIVREWLTSNGYLELAPGDLN